MREFWSSRRLEGLALATLMGVAIAVVVTLVRDNENTSMLKAGDFPGFYVPAKILAAGDSARLYDQALQRHLQNQVWPEFFKGAVYISVYPPYVGALLQPLVFLSPVAAGFVFRSLCLLCFCLAFWLLVSFNPTWRVHCAFGLMTLLAFHPVFSSVLGGQISAIAMLAHIWTIYLLRAKRAAYAGWAACLWLMKPQYGLLALMFTVLIAPRRMLLNALVASAVLYAIAASQRGLLWPIEWLEAVTRFSTLNYQSNSIGQVSLVGVMQALARFSGAQGQVAAVLLALGYAGALVVIAITARTLWRARNHPRYYEALFLLAPATTLISPQTLFYDLSLALFACWRFVTLERDRDVWLVLAAIAGVGLAALHRNALPVSPLILVNLWTFWFVRRSIAQDLEKDPA